jgi:hypothetical protein
VQGHRDCTFEATKEEITMSEGSQITSDVSAEGSDRESQTARGVKRWLAREIMGVVFVAATLFIPAGRLDWVMGWALVAIYAAWITA